MSITNYTELKTAVANWLHRTDLTSVIPDFVQLGENRLMDNLRIRAMENTATGTVSSSVSLPTGFVEMISLTVNSGGSTWPLTYVPPSELTADSGTPHYYSIVGDNLKFESSSSGYSYTITYYAPLDTVATTDNWLITNRPEAYLFASLVEAADYLRDDSLLQKYSARLKEVIAQLQQADRNDRYGNNLMVRAA